MSGIHGRIEVLPTNRRRMIAQEAAMAADVRNDRRALDDVDRRIVGLLREDARTPNSRLAELLGIAPSTCAARVASLVDRGVIAGFTAIVTPAAPRTGARSAHQRQHPDRGPAAHRRVPCRPASTGPRCGSCSSSVGPKTSCCTSPCTTPTRCASSWWSSSRRTRPWRRRARAWCSSTTRTSSRSSRMPSETYSASAVLTRLLVKLKTHVPVSTWLVPVISESLTA